MQILYRKNTKVFVYIKAGENIDYARYGIFLILSTIISNTKHDKLNRNTNKIMIKSLLEKIGRKMSVNEKTQQKSWLC